MAKNWWNKKSRTRWDWRVVGPGLECEVPMLKYALHYMEWKRGRGEHHGIRIEKLEEGSWVRYESVGQDVEGNESSANT